MSRSTYEMDCRYCGASMDKTARSCEYCGWKNPEPRAIFVLHYESMVKPYLDNIVAINRWADLERAKRQLGE